MVRTSTLLCCLLVAACAHDDAPGPVSGPPARLDAATVRSLDLEGRDGCPDGRWTPLAVTATDADGATREIWRAERCDTMRRLNFQVRDGADGNLEVTALLPGTTRLTPAQQRAVVPAVLEGVAAGDCRERLVTDTRATADGEIWTVDVCGDAHEVDVRLEDPMPGAMVLGIETVRLSR